jgi:hypothetical protein
MPYWWFQRLPQKSTLSPPRRHGNGEGGMFSARAISSRPANGPRPRGLAKGRTIAAETTKCLSRSPSFSPDTPRRSLSQPYSTDGDSAASASPHRRPPPPPRSQGTLSYNLRLPLASYTSLSDEVEDTIASFAAWAMPVDDLLGAVKVHSSDVIQWPVIYHRGIGSVVR